MEKERKKKKLVTRQEAAERLGVNVQTVSNWISEGLLVQWSPRKKEKGSGQKVQVLEESIDELIESGIHREATSLEAARHSLEAGWVDIQRRQEELSTAWEVLRVQGIKKYYLTKDPFWWEGLSALIEVISPELKDRERYIFEEVMGISSSHDTLGGVIRLSELGDRLGLSRERVRQIFNKTLTRIRKVHEDIVVPRETIAELTKRNHELHRALKEKEEEIDRLHREGCQARKKTRNKFLETLKKTKLSELMLSKRIMNCMDSAEVKNLYDFLCFRKEDFCKFRNMGKKSITEIEEVLEEYKIPGYDKKLTMGMVIDLERKRDDSTRHDSF